MGCAVLTESVVGSGAGDPEKNDEMLVKVARTLNHALDMASGNCPRPCPVDVGTQIGCAHHGSALHGFCARVWRAVTCGPELDWSRV
eukprot:1659516-Rhodomonas_salina.2